MTSLTVAFVKRSGLSKGVKGTKTRNDSLLLSRYLFEPSDTVTHSLLFIKVLTISVGSEINDKYTHQRNTCVSFFFFLKEKALIVEDSF